MPDGYGMGAYERFDHYGKPSSGKYEFGTDACDLIIRISSERTFLRGRMGPPGQRQGPMSDVALHCPCLSVRRGDTDCYGTSRA